MKRALWLIAGLGLALRVALASRSLAVVDCWFVPDDTYYTLGFARSLAHGLGPSLGGVPSNGFQPLLAFLLVPVFWLSHAPDTALRVLLLLCALLDSVNIVLLGQIAKRAGGERAALLSAGLWAVSPLAIASALGGLETALALALQLALALGYSRLRDQAGRLTTTHANQGWAALGACAGLCLLARVDAIFLIVAIGGFELYDARRRQVAMGACWFAVLGGALVLLPWWGYSLLRFHSVVPESGAAVLQITRIHRDLYLTLPKQLGWAAGSVLGAPLVDLPLLREVLFEQAALSWLAFLALLVMLGLAVRRSLRKAELAVVAVLSLHGLAILLFYALLVPALWFFKRYLAPCQALLALLIGLGLANWSRREGMSRLTRSVPWLAMAVLGAAGLSQICDFAFVTPEGSRDHGLHGAKGYREAAGSVLSALPRHTVLGAFQSGALSYYAPPSVRVVNLDGVVDGAARRAGAALTLSDYAFARHVSHLSDWPFNLACFARLSRRARRYPARLPLETSVAPQGNDRFLLYELRWP